MLLCMSIMLIAHAGGYVSRNITSHQLYLSSTTVVMSAQISALTADTQEFASQDAATLNSFSANSSKVSHSQPKANETSICNTLDKATAADCSESELVSHSDDFNFAPVNSQRFINLVQHDVREVKPNYLLAFEFTPESEPALGENLRLDARPDWTLLAESSPARISGWKVSNLQYRFSQQAA
ncbi:hypothetical protein HRJ35_08130 [Shewanella oneidensis MR-1]|nr:hypothetical protein HRJ35_08130 [Shewanella oneidensis MR-1]